MPDYASELERQITSPFMVECESCGVKMWDHEVRVDGDDALCLDCLDARNYLRVRALVAQIAWGVLAVGIALIIGMLIVRGIPQ